MCETDYGPFDDVKGGPMADAQGRLRMDIMNEEDKLLLNAIRELSSLSFTHHLVGTTLTLACFS